MSKAEIDSFSFPMSSSCNLLRWLGIELVAMSAAEKVVTALGGGLVIFLLMLISSWALAQGGAPAVVASMGTSEVLLFAASHAQLSQPWPVIAALRQTGTFVDVSEDDLIRLGQLLSKLPA